MNTVQAKWESFEQAVMPPDAGEHQRRDMRNAFYAGAAAAMNLTLTCAGMSEDGGVHAFQTLTDEVRSFLKEQQS